MAHGFSGMRFPGSRMLWHQVLFPVALLGWVGGLILAVSWQVLPMFYLPGAFRQRTPGACRSWPHSGPHRLVHVARQGPERRGLISALQLHDPSTFSETKCRTPPYYHSVGFWQSGFE